MKQLDKAIEDYTKGKKKVFVIYSFINTYFPYIIATRIFWDYC